MTLSDIPWGIWPHPWIQTLVARSMDINPEKHYVSFKECFAPPRQQFNTLFKPTYQTLTIDSPTRKSPFAPSCLYLAIQNHKSHVPVHEAWMYVANPINPTKPNLLPPNASCTQHIPHPFLPWTQTKTYYNYSLGTNLNHPPLYLSHPSSLPTVL